MWQPLVLPMLYLTTLITHANAILQPFCIDEPLLPLLSNIRSSRYPNGAPNYPPRMGPSDFQPTAEDNSMEVYCLVYLGCQCEHQNGDEPLSDCLTEYPKVGMDLQCLDIDICWCEDKEALDTKSSSTSSLESDSSDDDVPESSNSRGSSTITAGDSSGSTSEGTSGDNGEMSGILDGMRGRKRVL